MAIASVHARSEHTYPLTEKEARHAARLWFKGAPNLTLAAWRDNRCQAHCAGLPSPADRAEAFNAEFSREVACFIAGTHTTINTPACAEQIQPATEASPFDAGIQAAHTWFAQAKASAAAHCDNARCALVRSIADDSEASAASAMFNRGFARGLALVIAGGSSNV